MGKEEQVVSAGRVRSALRDRVAVLEIDNPPLAALTAETRASLMREIEAAAADDGVDGIVISGSGNVFATGAAATEQDGEDGPDLATLCDRIEALDKPVVAAINGSALGGGLELALAAHLRVARPSVRLGSPEITVGLVPGAGGTQRLPKVIGGIAALKMLLSGRAISGDSAAKLGLVDVLTPGDVVDEAVIAATRLAASSGELVRSSTRRDRLGEGTAFLEAVAEHRRIAVNSPLEAPARMIECVEAALLLPYEIGRGLEQAAYDDLVRSEHSQSLRHIFASERHLQAATRWEGRVPSRPLNSVAIVGARAAGIELAMLCLDAGFAVTVSEESDAALDAGVARIIEHYEARVAAGQMSEEGMEQILDRMHAVSGFKILADADFVVDPAPGTTRDRIAALDGVMKAGAVLALGVEGASLAEVAALTSRKGDVVGLRFPPGMRRNRLVELAVTEDTGPKAVATARALMRKLDRLILDVEPSALGVGTRLVEALHAAADLCLEEGARIAQIDDALRDWGIPFGSFALRDIVGLKRPGGPSGLGGTRGGGLDEALLAAGRAGVGAGRGYYNYARPGAPGIEAPEVLALAETDRAGKTIRPRTLTDGDVRLRCVAAMAGAGAEMLADGTVKRPSDIDMVAVHALGFARRTGGIMFAADLIGLEEMRDRLSKMAEVSSRIVFPASMFHDLIRSGKGFDALNA